MLHKKMCHLLLISTENQFLRKLKMPMIWCRCWGRNTTAGCRYNAVRYNKICDRGQIMNQSLAQKTHHTCVLCENFEENWPLYNGTALYSGRTRLKPWRLKRWLLGSPSHQQPWHKPCWINMLLPSIRRSGDFNSLRSSDAIWRQHCLR